MVQYWAVKEQHYQQDIGKYTAWGIKGSRSLDEKPGASSVYISDIFLNEKEAMDFALICTRLELSLIHLTDVVNDYLER